MESEDCHAGSHKRNDKIFVKRVALAENGEVQEHDGKKLAGLGEDEGDVVDVGKGGVAKRGCE